MGFLDNLFGKPKTYNVNPVREVLYGDIPLDMWPPDGASTEVPWNIFSDARLELEAGHTDAAIALWSKVVDIPNLESRHYAQAWNALRQHGVTPPAGIAKQVLGTVVEVGLPKGIDILAAYADHHARYYNFSGAAVIWEHPDNSLDSLIDKLLFASAETVQQIGPWEDARPPATIRGNVRLSFLTPSGIHFGDGPINVITGDAKGKAVMQSATQLMQALIQKSGR